MSDPLSKIRTLQGETQSAFLKAREAGDQEAMRRIEALFERLLQAEDRLLLNNLAVSAAAVADLAGEVERASREIGQTTDAFFLNDLGREAAELDRLSAAIHEEIRAEPAEEASPPRVDAAMAPVPGATEPASPPAATVPPSPAPDPPGPEAASPVPPVPAIPQAPAISPPRTPAEYAAHFDAMTIREDWFDDVDAIVDTFFSDTKNRRYRAVETATTVPWWAVAILHSLESSQNFRTHLHNGDPLSAPTVRVPAGRPANWRPGMTWEESAADALTMGSHRLDRVEDWSVGNALGIFERYNGLGYRNRGLMSPYLWSGSTYYDKGKFVADGRFDPEARSRQVGAAVLLGQMARRGELQISRTRNTVTPRAPAVLGSRELADLDLSPFPGAEDEVRFPRRGNARIRVGASGMAAKRVQEWCCLHGRTIPIDSDYGEATAHAVELFQRDSALPVTGEVDLTTWLLLTASLRRALVPVADQGSLNDTFLAIAEQHVSNTPREVGGNNRGPWVRLYMAGRDGREQLWCAGFVCTLMAQAARDLDIPMPFARRVGVDALVADAKRDGRFVGEGELDAEHLRSTKIAPGSLFVVRATPDDWTHVGIVTQVQANRFTTIEGNTNGQDNDGGNARASARNFVKKDFLRLA